MVSHPDRRTTEVRTVDASDLGSFTHQNGTSQGPLESWSLHIGNSPSAEILRDAAATILSHESPVAFPTETVYGLGADATSSAAVRSIFAAKSRPADNPLIVHIASLSQLRSLLLGSPVTLPSSELNSHSDPIPAIYLPLIQHFWPGPLTILLPLPSNNPLAPETTAAQRTFGARMPAHLLALALIRTVDRPIAAPSANASTRPSPTAAEHVFEDLQGRIEIVLDGGPCSVGVESTVVDGMGETPVVLRPGGIGLDEIRTVPGWEHTKAEWSGSGGAAGPRAPGMKYRHYSPRAKVVLLEAGRALAMDAMRSEARHASESRIGVVRTRRWQPFGSPPPDHNGDHENGIPRDAKRTEVDLSQHDLASHSPIASLLREQSDHKSAPISEYTIPGANTATNLTILDVHIGSTTADIARRLFSALRDLDTRNVGLIFVEGISDESDDISAAVMNRLRKAAEVVMT